MLDKYQMVLRSRCGRLPIHANQGDLTHGPAATARMVSNALCCVLSCRGGTLPLVGREGEGHRSCAPMACARTRLQLAGGQSGRKSFGFALCRASLAAAADPAAASQIRAGRQDVVYAK